MNAYTHPTRYIIHAWLQPIGRFGVILGGLILILFVLIDAEKYRLLVISGIVVFAVGGILTWVGFAIALTIKCDVCGKHPSILKKNSRFKPKNTRNEIEAIKNDFYPPELKEKKFICVHCGTEYFLNNKS
jgi:hypothetical protein